MRIRPILPAPVRLLVFISLCVLLTAQTHPAAPAAASSGSSPATHPQADDAISELGPHVVPPPPNYRYPNGQTFVYGVEWHLFNAGTAKVSIDNANGQQHVTALAESAGVANALYKVNDRFEAYFDPRSFCSLRILKHNEEGPHARQSEANFDYTRRKSTFDEKNLKTGETKHVESDLPGCVTDVVSGFYYLASLPLQPGSTYEFPAGDGAKITQIRARVEGREQIKVPYGTYNTVRVQAEAVSGALQGKGVIQAWFTDDANHIPVQMRSKLGWGTLLFRLQRIDKQ
ncbi:MAG TPA: DUF3108 domain-containing protein [Terriglobales bacterium]